MKIGHGYQRTDLFVAAAFRCNFGSDILVICQEKNPLPCKRRLSGQFEPEECFAGAGAPGDEHARVVRGCFKIVHLVGRQSDYLILRVADQMGKVDGYAEIRADQRCKSAAVLFGHVGGGLAVLHEEFLRPIVVAASDEGSEVRFPDVIYQASVKINFFMRVCDIGKSYSAGVLHVVEIGVSGQHFAKMRTKGIHIIGRLLKGTLILDGCMIFVIGIFPAAVMRGDRTALHFKAEDAALGQDHEINLTIGIMLVLRKADRVENCAVHRQGLELFEDFLLRTAGRIRDTGGQHDGLVHG